MRDSISAELNVRTNVQVSHGPGSEWDRQYPSYLLLHNDITQGIAESVALLKELE
jgi:hypothetical protein